VGKAGSPDGGGVGVAATGSSEGGLDVDSAGVGGLGDAPAKNDLQLK